MNKDFLYKREKIIASAIEIISEAGIESLTTKNLAFKENISEDLLYRYFGDIDEVLVEVVNTFIKYDDGIIATAKAKDISHIDKVIDMLTTFSINYNGYYALTAIPLNYEYLLHHVNTRDIIAECIAKRTDFVREELRLAINEGEIKDTYSPEELATIFFGTLERDLLNRRTRNERNNHARTAKSILSKITDSLRI